MDSKISSKVSSKKNAKVDKKALVRRVFTDPIYFLAFGFGAGLSPIAPGTMGTIVAIPLYLLLAKLSLFHYFIVVVLGTILGVIICDDAARRIGVHDFSGIVWDEIIGYLWMMMGLPLNWIWIIFGFFLFRLFDIWKPWPISWMDREVKGGLGIMVDDLMAAFYARLSIYIIMFGMTILLGYAVGSGER
jgi:phosphatidylglycerophosphatase A